MPDPADLITPTFLLPYLPATQSAAEAANVAAWITAASKAAVRFARRQFINTAHDEIRTPQPAADQWTNTPPEVQLRQFPVIPPLTSVQGGRCQAMVITNTNNVLNQRAWFRVDVTGDPQFSLIPVGVTLYTMASGVATTTPFLFSAYPTAGALGAAINALGNGWKATVQPTFALYPSSDLIAAYQPIGCLTGGTPITSPSLDIFATDLSIADISPDQGIIYVWPGSGGISQQANQWPYASPEDQSFGAFSRQVRVRYQAGFATIPENVQVAVAVIVQGMFFDARVSGIYKSETAGNVSYTLADRMDSIPAEASQLLSPYRRLDL